MIPRLTNSLLFVVVWVVWVMPAQAGPLLTGIVEDVNAQSIEMPSLPGGWQRRIEWMAPEGSEVSPADLVVKLDPGDLLSREEQSRTDLEKQRLAAQRRIDELRLELLDAEGARDRAESLLRMAELDAVIPANAIAKLDYDRYQLAASTARTDLVRAEAALLNKREELSDVIAETRLEVSQAESSYGRIKAALDATEIRAEKAGFVIYAANRQTGRKVFPGETHFSGSDLAYVASRDDLQIRFWVHEADTLQVKSGQQLSVIADAQGSRAFAATVEWTSSQAVVRDDWSDSGYFETLARPTAGLPENIMPGMSVMGALSSPDSAP